MGYLRMRVMERSGMAVRGPEAGELAGVRRNRR
jgi:hypothetical protein